MTDFTGSVSAAKAIGRATKITRCHFARCGGKNVLAPESEQKFRGDRECFMQISHQTQHVGHKY